jgi:hypothetical protein
MGSLPLSDVVLGYLCKKIYPNRQGAQTCTKLLKAAVTSKQVFRLKKKLKKRPVPYPCQTLSQYMEKKIKRTMLFVIFQNSKILNGSLPVPPVRCSCPGFFTKNLFPNNREGHS